MKNLILTFTFIVSILLSPIAKSSTSGEGRFGLGLALSRFVAVTGKYWVGDKQAVDFGVGTGSYSWLAYGDFLWHFPALFGNKTAFVQQLNGYVGVGGGFSSWNNPLACNRWWCDPYGVASSGTVTFLKVPVGLEWYPGEPPLGVFLELLPYFTISPWQGSSVDLSLGARYYF